MSKITNVLIIDANTIRLEEDAKKGDEIDLTLLNKVDVSNILKQIEISKDNLYNQKINLMKEQLKKEYDSLFKLELNKKENEFNARLNEMKNENLRLGLDNKNLTEKINIEVELAKTLKEKEYKDKVNDKEKEIARLNALLESKILEKEVEYNQNISLIKAENQEKLLELEKELSKLKLEKSNINNKLIGEELESWCDVEYSNYAQIGFETCTWEKDNTSVKEDDEVRGTKGDYIFKVYATAEKKAEQLLSSVLCEMKNENPLSKNKKKNADHYKKLDGDRRKKNCEYALLISELEWDNFNDIPIRKVNEYDKMFLVRPQYFITFLMLICNMNLKFKDLLLEQNRLEEEFRDHQEILNEFDNFKQALLDKPIMKLEKEVESIKKNANEIIKISNKINDSANEITYKVIEQIKNKINNFNINKLTKKINKINNN